MYSVILSHDVFIFHFYSIVKYFLMGWSIVIIRCTIFHRVLLTILPSLHYDFQSKKIVGNNFDTLPLHGLGKDYSSTWWKALAAQLIANGIISWTSVIFLYFFA